MVIDERSRRPLRAIIGELLLASESADIAIARVRLAALDLTEDEVRGPALCRVLLGHLDASTLLDAAGEGGVPRPELRGLGDWLASERLQVRSAGIGAWIPDFSVFRSRDHTATSLVGAHYFGSPQLTVGPSVTAILPDPATARLLERRFQELWEGAHDVAPAIQQVLARAAGRAAAGGPANPAGGSAMTGGRASP